MDCNGVRINESGCIRGRQTAGRGAFAKPVGFAIHSLGMTLDQYRDKLSRKFTPHIKTNYPKSVNYVITRNGFAELIVPVGNTPAAFDQVNQLTYPLYPPNAQNPNEPFIHIAFEDELPTSIETSAAASLICCLSRSLGIQLQQDQVFPAYFIDASRRPETVSTAMVASAIACITSNGNRALFEECCDNASNALQGVTQLNTALAALTQRVVALEAIPNPTAAIAQLQADIAAIQTNASSLQMQVSQWQSAFSSIGNRIAALEACMMKLPECAAVVPCGEFLYTVSQCQNLIPSVPVTLDFDRKVSDADLLVTTGPMWSANIVNNTANPVQYTLSGSIQIESSQWCVDKYARLLLQTCDGSVVEVARYTAPSNGDQPSQTLTWTYPVTIVGGSTCQTRLRFETNDVTTPFKSVCVGAIQGRRS